MAVPIGVKSFGNSSTGGSVDFNEIAADAFFCRQPTVGIMTTAHFRVAKAHPNRGWQVLTQFNLQIKAIRLRTLPPKVANRRRRPQG